ncbi:MAG: S-layer homology domain-containing protein [Oscillospiraceae bacterium]|jgi:hypothetical protein|nr:S-layer homology domain-containing protein [Oscillospiraceae bacterium]
MRKQSTGKTARKGIAAILAAVMLTALLPLGVFAAAEDATPAPRTHQTDRPERTARPAPALPAVGNNREAFANRAPLQSEGPEFEAKAPLNLSLPIIEISYIGSSDIDVYVPFGATGAAAQGTGWSWNAATKTLTVTGDLQGVGFDAVPGTNDSVTIAYSANITIVEIWSGYFALTVKGNGKTGSTLTTAYIDNYLGDITVQDAKIDIKPLDGGTHNEQIFVYGDGGGISATLTVKNSTLTFYGPGTEQPGSIGTYLTSHGKLVIEDSDITATGDAAQILAYQGGLSVKNSILSLTGGAATVGAYQDILSIAGGSSVSLDGEDASIVTVLGSLSIAGGSSVSLEGEDAMVASNNGISIAGGSTLNVTGDDAEIFAQQSDLIIKDGSKVNATGEEVYIYTEDGNLSITTGSKVTITGKNSELSTGNGDLSITNSTVVGAGEAVTIKTYAGNMSITDSKVTLTGDYAEIYGSAAANILIAGKSKVYVQTWLYTSYGTIIVDLTPGGRVEVGEPDVVLDTDYPVIEAYDSADSNRIILGAGVKIVTPADGKISTYDFTGNGDYRTGVFTGNISGGITEANFAYHVVLENPADLRTGWNPFTDVTTGDWFYNNVKFIYENRIFAGTSDTTFDPGTPMTRAMLVQVLWSYEGKPEPATLSGFSDVPTDAYYAKAVAWALANGIVSGIGDNQFGSSRAVSRQDFVLILTKYAAKKYVELPQTRAYAAFTDQASIAGYATAAVEAAYRAGIINGKDGGIFDPASGATRAEVAVMLHKYVLIADA